MCFETKFPRCGTHYTPTWFVAADVTKSKIVLSFRGSEALNDYIITDANCSNISYPACESINCKVYAGFYGSWLEAKPLVQAGITNATNDPRFSGYGLVFIGHSLGAAQALFAALDYRQSGYTVDLVSC